MFYISLLNLSEKISKRCQSTGKIIEKICELYALDCWVNKPSIFLELGCSTEEFKVIREKHLNLCEEIGNDALEIIESICSTDRFIGSSIGHSDGQVYKRIVERVESEPGVYDSPTWFSEIQKTRKAYN